ncbi:hypothetical protein T439DRAFT_354224 [Meredithblackwellia eburnea MCA 4105]
MANSAPPPITAPLLPISPNNDSGLGAGHFAEDGGGGTPSEPAWKAGTSFREGTLNTGFPFISVYPYLSHSHLDLLHGDPDPRVELTYQSYVRGVAWEPSLSGNPSVTTLEWTPEADASCRNLLSEWQDGRGGLRDLKILVSLALKGPPQLQDPLQPAVSSQSPSMQLSVESTSHTSASAWGARLTSSRPKSPFPSFPSSAPGLPSRLAAPVPPRVFNGISSQHSASPDTINSHQKCSDQTISSRDRSAFPTFPPTLETMSSSQPIPPAPPLEIFGTEARSPTFNYIPPHTSAALMKPLMVLSNLHTPPSAYSESFSSSSISTPLPSVVTTPSPSMGSGGGTLQYESGWISPPPPPRWIRLKCFSENVTIHQPQVPGYSCPKCGSPHFNPEIMVLENCIPYGSINHEAETFSVCAFSFGTAFEHPWIIQSVRSFKTINRAAPGHFHQ